MQFCPNCGVHVAGDKCCCPLCKGRLEGTGAPETEVFPPLCALRRPERMVMAVMTAVCIAVSVICVVVNMLASPRVWWCLFVVAGLACAWLVTKVGLSYRKDVMQNIGWETLLVSALSVLWDAGTGWQGWSLGFVFPCACLTGLVLMLVLALCMHTAARASAGPFGALLVLGILSGVPAVTGLIAVRLPALLCSGICLILLAGALIFFRHTFVAEAKRRFHL